MPKKDDYPDESKMNRGAKLESAKTVEWLEVPVFIHGISPDKYPGGGQKEYLQLYKLVREKLKKYPEKKLLGQPIFVTWGVPTRPASNGTDQYLAQVERSIQAKVKAEMGNSAYSNPLGAMGYIRDFLFYGIADLFYYISADGEKDLRKHVFNHISRAIQIMDKENAAYISLTIFAHSAGSVIAHDMLYHMFSSKEHPSEEGIVEDEMDALRKIIKGGRLRIRHLYTFGSPISLLILRASALVEKFRKGGLFAPREIGLLMGDNLKTPRWVNFWSRHDIASYPVDFLYANEKGLIEDHEISTSVNPKTAHTGYWGSSEMAEYVADTF